MAPLIQYTSGDRIRAVENGFTLIRCSSDGVSAVVSPRSFFHSLSITLSLSLSRSHTLAHKNTRAHARVHSVSFSHTHTRIHSSTFTLPLPLSHTRNAQCLSVSRARMHASFSCLFSRSPTCSHVCMRLLSHRFSPTRAHPLKHTPTLSFFPSLPLTFSQTVAKY